MSNRAFLSILSVAAALAVAALSAAGAQETYNLRRVYRAGDQDRFRMTTVIQGEGVDVKTALVIVEKVKDVKPDGTAIVVTTIESGTMEVNGQVSPFPGNGQSVTTTVDRNGKVVKREGLAGALDDVLASGSAALPDRQVRIGERIKVETPIGAGRDAAKGIVTIDVVGKEKPGADLPVETIKVTTATTKPVATPEGAEPVSITGAAYIEPGTGKVLKMVGTVKGTLPPPLGKATVTFTRVRIGDKDAPGATR